MQFIPNYLDKRIKVFSYDELTDTVIIGLTETRRDDDYIRIVAKNGASRRWTIAELKKILELHKKYCIKRE